MKFTDYKNEDALDLLADLLEPASEIFSDKEMLEAFKKENTLKAVKIAMKGHKKSLIEILAILDGIPVEKADYNALVIMKKSLEILSDKELLGFFTSQAMETEDKSSKSLSENTEEIETK